MKIHLTENPPQSTIIQPPQDVGLFPEQNFLGFDVRLRLKNYWFIAQSELRAELVEKREAGSEKNKVGNTRHCRSQGFQCYNLSTVLNLTRLETQFVSDKKRS